MVFKSNIVRSILKEILSTYRHLRVGHQQTDLNTLPECCFAIAALLQVNVGRRLANLATRVRSPLLFILSMRPRSVRELLEFVRKQCKIWRLGDESSIPIF